MEKLGIDSIQSPLPLNLKDKDAQRFVPFQTYPRESISISELSYVMVTRSGIVFKRFQVVAESVYVHKDRYWKYWKSAILNFLFRRKIVLSSTEKYTLGHNYYCPGYYHWITEALPRLMALGNQVHQLNLLLPEYTDPDIERTLEIFNFKSIYRIKEGTAIYLKHLMLPSQPKFGDTYDPVLLGHMRQKFCEYAQSRLERSFDVSTRIYVSRRKARARKVSNENQVLEVLAKYGFVDLCFEDLTFFEKVVCMKNATHFISIHGAGLTNMIFMPMQSFVLEFYRDFVTPDEYHSKSYWRMAGALGLNYLYQLCPTPAAPVSMDTDDLVVDLDELERNLAIMGL